ncbi:hypothetical protein FRC12_003177 [Ceratobasidium sp. 428]|nr:hypothetical protein FRC12_003177 [Ceratobasidium sp. 428]
MATTRSQTILRGHSDKIAKARWRYDNSRSALLQLGPNDSDKRMFRVMTNNDMRTLKEYLEDISHGRGQGYVAISWIWCSTGVPKDDKWQLEALKTEWFRSRERYKRWREQLVLLKREMTMAIRTFRKWEAVWKWKAQSRHSTPGMRAYAFKQSRFYGEHAIRALRTFRPYLDDEIVTLKWTQDWLHTHTNGDRFVDSVP